MGFILYIFLLFLLVLLQISFFPHFFSVPFLNFVLIAAVFYNIFEKGEDREGLILAVFAGFFLDIFSQNFFGFWMLVSFALAVFIKFVLKKYFDLSWRNTLKIK